MEEMRKRKKKTLTDPILEKYKDRSIGISYRYIKN